MAGECNELLQGIPYAFIDYFEPEVWLELVCCFGKNYHGAVGSLDELALFAEHTGKRWISGKHKLQKMLH